MKIYLLFLIISLFNNSYAEVGKVVKRNKSYKLEAQNVNIDELAINESGDGFKYFNIVKGVEENERPISTLTDEEKLRVLTLGYHLNKARKYFEEVMGAENYLASMEKITVRYDMARGFSPGRHFSSSDNEFNNAVTNKASNKFILEKEGIKKWGNEIWFRPAVATEVHNPNGSTSNDSDISNELFGLADSAIVDLTKGEALGLGTGFLVANSNHYIYQLGLILLLKKLVPTTLDFVVSSIPFKIKLDTAMVPEIIYHEFTHMAMSDIIPLTGSFAVTEGMANYFAAVISGNTEIAGELGKNGQNIKAISIKENIKFKPELESDSNQAHSPFTYNYLWAIRERIGQNYRIDNIDGKLIFDRIVYESRNYLDLANDNTITFSLPKALQKASNKIIQDPDQARDIRLIISQEANKFGM